MRKLALIALIASASPALAEDITLDSVLGTTLQEIRTSVTAMGYEIRKSEIERGKIEIYVVGNGQQGEVYVNPQTGAVTKIEMR